MTDICNIAAVLPDLAAERPGQIAIHCPDDKGRYAPGLSYAELERRSNAIAAGLALQGIGRGTRTVVMVRPSPEFFLLMFALFKVGAVPVLVDPGIDKRALKQCLDEAQPEAFIGIPLAHAARKLLGWASSAGILITVGRRLGWGGSTLAQAEQTGTEQAGDEHFGATQASSAIPLAATAPDDIAAILFTSGSTGVPKGVVYRHRHFVAQIALLREAFDIQPGGVDLPTFPPFALFDPALGLTSVIPDMDPTRPAGADPRKLHAAIARFGVTQLFGSPALMQVLADHGQPLDGIRQVTSAGAPVPPDVVERIRALLPAGAKFWTPYGATECLPVAVIEGHELQGTRAATEAGAGTCVGHPVPANEVRIIAIDDEPIGDWSQALPLPVGEVGEITVAGPTATDCYFNRDSATRAAKIHERLADGSQRVVHRMGDVGYFDEHGRLWFCGRKTQRLETGHGPMYTERIEPVFNAHPLIRRSALVGIGQWGQQVPVLCYELQAGVTRGQHAQALAALRQMAAKHPPAAHIRHFLRHPGFPVDIRHNAKIGREKLAVWAAAQLGKVA